MLYVSHGLTTHRRGQRGWVLCELGDQLYTLSRVLEGAWEFAQPVQMCSVDLEKAFHHVPRGVLWGVLQEYGVSDPLIRAVCSLQLNFIVP